MDHSLDIAQSEHERQFAELLARLIDEIAEGKSYTLKEVCGSYPDFAAELRELWGTFAVTRAAGSISVSAWAAEEQLGSALQMELPCDLGKYTLQQEIGRGGMGVVYRATRNSDSRLVAVKMILNGEFASDTIRQRFLREATAATQLNHPHIVPILEIHEFRGMPYFAMELVEGQTLTRIVEAKPPSIDQAVLLTRKISDAIHYAHQQGVLHRDIKPSNILVDHSGEPFILDFGLARLEACQQDLTRSGMMIGTPGFMSPEAASGQRDNTNPATDVYGLGVVLYYMLTGRPPFNGKTTVATLLMAIEQDPASPREFNPDIDRDLERIVLRCLHKSPDLRYESAQALANDLTANLNNLPIAARENRLSRTIGNVMRETHHAPVLGNWGMLWIWQSLVILFASLTTHLNFTLGGNDRRDYILVWTGKFLLWAIVFWWLRRRMGQVTFVERQVAHVWFAGLFLIILINAMEAWMGLTPLALSPLWAVVLSMTFFIKGGILAGSFYIQAALLLVSGFFMAAFPANAMIIFGLTASACFFWPGLKIHRRTKPPE